MSRARTFDRGPPTAGFTIVEVLVALAINGGRVLSQAAIPIDGEDAPSRVPSWQDDLAHDQPDPGRGALQ